MGTGGSIRRWMRTPWGVSNGWLIGLAALLCLLLAGCDGASGQTPDLDATPTPGQVQQNLTYVGSDGNIWTLSLPHGSASRLTSDAQGGSVSYSGLVWSPNGSYLAAIRETQHGKLAQDDLIVLEADNDTIEVNTPLPATPYGQRLIWSPDNHFIAYRLVSSRNTSAQLVVAGAITGQRARTRTYPFQPHCVQPATPLRGMIAQAHVTSSDNGVDTFSWSLDGRSILASANCGNTSAVRVDLVSGKVVVQYPGNASYQPQGHLLLGTWSNGDGSLTLGEGDASGTLTRTLLSAHAATSARYPITLGAAIWSANGQSLYYEYQDGIWRMDTNGRGVKELVRGSATDAHHMVTIEMAPTPSPDGQMLLYEEVHGADQHNGAVTSQWNVLLPGDAQPTILTDVTSEAVWQPQLCPCQTL